MTNATITAERIECIDGIEAWDSMTKNDSKPFTAEEFLEAKHLMRIGLCFANLPLRQLDAHLKPFPGCESPTLDALRKLADLLRSETAQ